MSKLLLSLKDYEDIVGVPWRPPESRPDTASLYRKNRPLVLQKNGGYCVYCGALADSVDHVIPQSQGGASDLDNLEPCCCTCNRKKKGRTPKEAGMAVRMAE